MQVKIVCCVRDILADLYMDPFTSPSTGAAIRAFGDGVNNPDTPMFKHPEDYELCKLGTYNDGTGMFEVGVPVQISSGKSVFKREALPPVQAELDVGSQMRNGVRL